MSAVKKVSLISVEDYLDGELVSPIKHEYLGGVVYAMAGARNVHNDIAGASTTTANPGCPCRPYNSDTKVRVRLSTHTRFYYPDAMVVCQANPPDDSFQDHPVVVAEVLSNATRRTDEGEKKDAYLSIPTLSRLRADRIGSSASRRASPRTRRRILRRAVRRDRFHHRLRRHRLLAGLSELYERVDFAAARGRGGI